MTEGPLSVFRIKLRLLYFRAASDATSTKVIDRVTAADRRIASNSPNGGPASDSQQGRCRPLTPTLYHDGVRFRCEKWLTSGVFQSGIACVTRSIGDAGMV